MIAYWWFKFSLWLVRRLSFKTLFRLSDVFYWLLYKVIKYRLKVVRANLALAFPEKTPEQRLRIEQDFYRHLADLFLETLKFYTLDKEQIRQHLVVENPQLLNQYYYAGQSIILAGAHIGNWELGALSAPLWFKHQFIILYKPLKNSRIDRLLKKLRSKFGSRMISIDITARSFMYGNKPFCVVMLSDQNPPNPNKSLWVRFFDTPTATLHGLELYSRRFNLPIFYYDMKKLARGKYLVTVEPLVLDPRSEPKGAITYKYMKRVEKAIKEKPYMWLWSHRRWKHQFDQDKYVLYEF